jgi:hypothetical protein
VLVSSATSFTTGHGARIRSMMLSRYPVKISCNRAIWKVDLHVTKALRARRSAMMKAQAPELPPIEVPTCVGFGHAGLRLQEPANRMKMRALRKITGIESHSCYGFRSNAPHRG